MYIRFMGVKFVRPVLEFFERNQTPVGPVWTDLRLPEPAFDDDAALVPADMLNTALDRCARSSGTLNAGFLAAARTSIHDWGGLDGALAGSRTLGDAMRKSGGRAANGCFCGPLELDTAGGRARLGHLSQAGKSCLGFTVSQFNLMMWIEWIRLVAGPSWIPDEVLLGTAAVRGAGPVSELAGTRISRNGLKTGVCFPAEFLDRRLPSPTRSDAARNRGGSAPVTGVPRDFAEAVQRILEMLLPQGESSIDVVSGICNTSVRSLQRRLAAAGVTYSRVLDRARFNLSRHLLETTGDTLNEIALEVGYSDLPHFTRAFRRWTGSSPGQYRQTLARMRSAA